MARIQQLQAEHIFDLKRKIYRSARFLLLISQFLACAPLFVHDKILWSKVKKWQQIVHFMLISMAYTLVFYCVATQWTTFNDTKFPMVMFPLYLMEFITLVVHLLYLIVRSYCGREKFQRIFNFIIDFDQRLLLYKISLPQFDYHAHNIFVKKHYFLIVFHTIVTCSLIFVIFHKTNYYMNTAVAYILPNFAIHTALLQYYVLLRIIKERFEVLNELLHEELTEHQIMAHEITLHKRLQNLRLLYAKLQIFAKDVNDTFAASTVLVYVAGIPAMSENLFFLYKTLLDTHTINLMSLLATFWFLMHISRITCILFYNYCIQNAKHSIIDYLKRLKYNNVRLQDIIRHFLLQLLTDTRSNVACGIFKLNLSAFIPLLIGVANFIIFLIQYDATIDALIAARMAPPPIKN